MKSKRIAAVICAFMMSLNIFTMTVAAIGNEPAAEQPERVEYALPANGSGVTVDEYDNYRIDYDVLKADPDNCIFIKFSDPGSFADYSSYWLWVALADSSIESSIRVYPRKGYAVISLDDLETEFNQSITEDIIISPYIAVSDVEIVKKTEITSDGVTYECCGSYAMVKSYDKSMKSLTIPETVNGKTVTAVLDTDDLSESSIESLTVAATVNWVGNYSLFGCSALKSAVFYGDTGNITESGFGYYGQDMWLRNEDVVISANYNSAPARYARDYDYSIKYLDVYEEKNYSYYINSENEAEIVSYNGTASTVVIPETLGGKTVTAICENAFKNNNTITKVTFNQSLRKVGDRAFLGCIALKTAVFSGDLERIGREAFESCSKLSSITFPGSILRIGYDAFSNTAWFDGLVAAGKPVIAGDILYNAGSVKGEYTVPENVRMIQDNAFINNSDITSVIVGENVEMIGGYAFYNCPNLTDYTFDSNCLTDYETGIGKGYDSNGNDIDFSGSVTVRCLYGSAIYESVQESNANIQILNSITQDGICYVTETDEYYDEKETYLSVFSCDSTQKTVVIPGEVEGYPVRKILQKAFRNNTVVEELTIPETVTSMDYGALAGCSSLKKLYVLGDTSLSDSCVGYDNSEDIRYTGLKIYGNYSGRARDYAEQNGFGFEAIDTLSEGDFDYIISGTEWYWDDENDEDVEVTTATIIRYRGKEANLTIPETLGGAFVNRITEGAFNNNTTLKELHFEHSQYWVTVDSCSFTGCSALKNIYSKGRMSLDYRCIGFADDLSTKYSGVVFHCPKDSMEYYYAKNNGFGYDLTDCKKTGDFFYYIEEDGDETHAEIVDYYGNASSVTVPSQVEGVAVTDIDAYAFKDKTGLKSIVLPDELINLENEAFAGCTSLKTITFPDTLVNIGRDALTSTLWYDQQIKKGGPVIAGTVLLAWPDASGDIVIPENIVKISYDVFANNDKITSVRLNDGLSMIDDGAFFNCKNLREVTSENPDPIFISYRAIGYVYDEYHDEESRVDPDLVLKCCYGSGLYDYAVENGIKYELFGAKKEGNYTYVINDDGDEAILISYDGTEKKVTVPETLGGLTVGTVSGKAFEGNSTVTEIVLPESVYSIRDDAFFNCRNLKKITVPGDIYFENTGIQYYIEDGMIEIKTGLTVCGHFGDYPCDFAMNYGFGFEEISSARYGDFIIADNDEDSLRIIGYLGNDTKVTVPGKINGKIVTYVGSDCFRYRQNITELTLGEGISGYGWAVLGNLGQLRKLTLPGTLSSVSDINDVGEQLEELVLGEGITYIYRNACTNITNLSKITIPSTVTYFGDEAFEGTAWLEAQRKKAPLVTVNNIIIDGKTCKGSVTIPSSTEKIAGSAFKGNKNITSVKLNDSLTEIGSYAFVDCTALKELTVPQMTLVGNEAIGMKTVYDEEYDYYKTEADEDFVIKCRFDSSAYWYAEQNNIAFELIDKKTSGDYEYAEDINGNAAIIKYIGSGGAVVIPETLEGLPVKKIIKGAFKGNKKVTSVSMSSVEELGSGVFEDCTALKSAVLSSGIHLLPERTFKGCTALKTVKMPENGKFDGISDEAFRDCSSLTSVTVPENCRWISLMSFRGCTALNEIKGSGSKLTYISPGAFEDTKLYNEQMDQTGMFILFDILLRTRGLTGEVTLPDGIRSVWEHAFDESDGVTSVILPDTVELIGSYAMAKLDKLTKIVVPASVHNLGYMPFGLREYYDEDLYEYVTESNPDLTVFCSKGSEAEKYAKDSGFKISYIDSTLKGDVNGDSHVTTFDVGLMRLYIKDNNTPIYFSNADLNNDKKVDKADLQLLERKLTDVHIDYWGMG